MKQQLLISLEPFEDECLSSYITRLTIENLYDSVSWICKNIGTTKDHLFDVQPDSPIIKELNKLTGVPIYKLNKLTYTFELNEGLIWIESIIDRHYGKICPNCLQENPYYRKMWNYKTVTACHKHKCLLVRQCTTCKKRISHYKENMETCSCGTKLTEIEPIKADYLDTNYSRLIGQKVNRLNTDLVNVEMYEKLMYTFSLEEILYLTEEFIRETCTYSNNYYSFGKIRDEREGYLEFIRNIYQIFNDWPWGFRAYLDYFKKEHEPTWEDILQARCYSNLSSFVTRDLDSEKFLNFKYEFKKYIPFHLIRGNLSIEPVKIYMRKLSEIQLDKYHLEVDTVKKLIIDEKIACPKYHPIDLDDDVKYFSLDEDSLRNYTIYMQQFISKEETLKRLGITSDILNGLVERHCIIYDDYLESINYGKSYKEFDVNRLAKKLCLI